MVTNQRDVVSVLGSQSEIEKESIFGSYHFQGSEAQIYLVS